MNLSARDVAQAISELRTEMAASVSYLAQESGYSSPLTRGADPSGYEHSEVTRLCGEHPSMLSGQATGFDRLSLSEVGDQYDAASEVLRLSAEHSELFQPLRSSRGAQYGSDTTLALTTAGLAQAPVRIRRALRLRGFPENLLDESDDPVAELAALDQEARSEFSGTSAVDVTEDDPEIYADMEGVPVAYGGQGVDLPGNPATVALVDGEVGRIADQYASQVSGLATGSSRHRDGRGAFSSHVPGRRTLQGI